MGSLLDKEFSKKDLDLRLVGLNEIVKILSQRKIKYRIAAGTLLGFYRDRAFIPWDNDVDIFFNVDDIYNQKNYFIDHLKKKHFEIILNSKKMSYKCFGFRAKKYGTRYEFSGFYENKKYVMMSPKWNIGFKYPKKLFNSLGTIKFKDYEYQTFSNIEEFLSLQYGNWKTPKKSNYLTYKIRTNYFNPIVRLVMKISYLKKKYLNET